MKRVIQFTKLRFLMIILSLLLIIGGAMGYFLRGGFNLGIDFTAGLSEQIQITLTPQQQEEIPQVHTILPILFSQM